MAYYLAFFIPTTSFCRYAATTMDADSLPHTAALHPMLPGVSAFRENTATPEAEPQEAVDQLEENELTLGLHGSQL